MPAVASGPDGYRVYQDLAPWWPLISPVAEYAADAAVLRRALSLADGQVRTALDLGCGGGHVAAHLKDTLSMTLVDLSAQMLAVSRQLNPECAHELGDMRTLRLGHAFDAVLVHDAVDYITSAADLDAVLGTAHAHCRPGGVAVFMPDHTAETFRPGTGGGGGTDAAGRQASFRERTFDPETGDDWIESEYEFVLRDADGTVQIVHETHRLGAFTRGTWLSSLTRAGFVPRVWELPDPDRLVFIGLRPLTSPAGGGLPACRTSRPTRPPSSACVGAGLRVTAGWPAPPEAGEAKPGGDLGQWSAMSAEPQREDHRDPGIKRMLTLSDGVVAIALTPAGAVAAAADAARS